MPNSSPAPHDWPKPFYRTHVFVCTTQVEDPRCCGAKDSEALCLLMRRRVRALGWTHVCVTKAGCMGRCLSGPSLVIYPDNVWYSPKNEDDIHEILEKHLGQGELVRRLLMGETEIDIGD